MARWQVRARVAGFRPDGTEGAERADVTVLLGEADSILELAMLATAVDALPAVYGTVIERRTQGTGALEITELARLVLDAADVPPVKKGPTKP